MYALNAVHVPGVDDGVVNLFNRTCDALRGDFVHEAMNCLYYGLTALRQNLSPEDWRSVRKTLHHHRLNALLLHSPVVQHTLQHPPGCPSDAALMDVIYGCGAKPAGASPLGQALFAWEMETPGFRSFRHRRLQLAREIDLAAASRGFATVMAAACGRLRELELSSAVREGRIRLTAVDLERDAVALVAREYGALGVTARVGTALDVIRRQWAALRFDLAYAGGHYEYLEDSHATALTTILFSTLAPGGRLILSSITPDARDAGYREACLGWPLIQRDAAQLEALLHGIPSAQIHSVERFRATDDDICYVRVMKR